MGVERRKFIRFLIQDNTFARLGSVFYKVGKVNDISIKGLSFSYLSENIKAGSNSDSSWVDIFFQKIISILPMYLARSYMTFQTIYSAKIIVS